MPRGARPPARPHTARSCAAAARSAFMLAMGLLAPLVLATLVPPSAAAAQAAEERAFPAPDRVGSDGGWLTSPAGAFTASLVLPGAGQAALGLSRWVVFVAAEAGFWALRLDALSDERRYRAGYRDLAWEVARLQGGGMRRDGPWGYYEAMSNYMASGAFDRDPGTPGIQPETDPFTYNGAVWDVARGMFLPGGSAPPGTPEHDRALAYYEARAAGPEFLWSWAGREQDLERFRGLIGRADDHARRATTALGLVLANHAVAAVDAVLAARLREQRRVRLESGVDAAGPDLRWRVGVAFSTPW